MTTTVPGWLDELRLDPGPPFLTMGTRALSLTDWFIVDEHRDEELRYKAHLLETVRPTVFAAQEGSESPATELSRTIRRWLADRHIAVPGPSGDDHPLVEAALLVQEDLAIMQHVDGQWILTAGVVCFPTNWTVADKIGLSLERIHAPVAHFERELRERVDRFHDRLAPDRPVWRRNWNVMPTDELHLPAFGRSMKLETPIAPDGFPMWIRSERQTLRRLPETDAIVFTIRIQRAPLGVLRDRLDIAAMMLTSTRSWDRDKRMYTSTGGALDELTTWLESLVGHDG